MKRFGVAAAVVMLVVLGLPAVVSAKPAPIVCPASGTLEITASIRLTGDLACNLFVDSDATTRPLITIALAGHTLTGTIDSDGFRVEVTNGMVDGDVVDSIGVLPGFGGTAATITRVTVTGDVAGCSCTIRHSMIAGSLSPDGGLIVHDTSVGGALTLNDDASSYSLSIARSRLDGIVVDDQWVGGQPDITGTIKNNVIAGGVDLGPGSDLGDLTIARNTITGDVRVGGPPPESFQGPGSVAITGNTINGHLIIEPGNVVVTAKHNTLIP